MPVDTPQDSKVLIGLTTADEDPEKVLIGYLTGVEALRAGKAAAFWLTKDAVSIAREGFANTIDIEGAPQVSDLHAEFVERGGRFFACPVCIKLRNLEDAPLADNAVIAGLPAVYEYTDGGALVFNY